ncbi:hypothetical protein JTE90_003912 [Oedothorax gibbosus]|uniref:Nudix hydrolase domain-containing protein n=1 Tax=Oedothorax gibbosus TaxID=931172 RepID=A0AAV6TM22_9ARAC|nr:hypothetical protein JTE90_003912 [Oedothorax gibbosus]
MPGHKLSTTYGVVKTFDNRIVIICRKVPYCVQNYYHRKNRKTKPCDNFAVVRDQFEKEQLPLLKPYDQLDYQRFIQDLPYEDRYDFPHGQLAIRKPSSIYTLFKEAYREFEEESGFRFKFIKKDIEHYPLLELEFNGCDGVRYRQYFFYR